MREIKFRFFSNPDEKMYALTLLGLNWELESDPSVYEGKNVWDGREGIRVQRYSDGHLMQFTGLKDKNGKEIYEGDIFDSNVKGFAPCVVGFNRGAFVFSEDGDEYNLGQIYSTIEVIGNIYESPEIIEKSGR